MDYKYAFEYCPDCGGDGEFCPTVVKARRYICQRCNGDGRMHPSIQEREEALAALRTAQEDNERLKERYDEMAAARWSEAGDLADTEKQLSTAQERISMLERTLGYGRGYLQAVVDSKAALDKDAKDWEHAFVGALYDLQEFSVAHPNAQKGEGDV